MSGQVGPGSLPLVDVSIPQPASGFPDEPGYLLEIFRSGNIQDKRVPSHPYIVTRILLAR